VARQLNRGSEVVVLLLWGKLLQPVLESVWGRTICNRLGPSREVSPSRGAMGQSNRLHLRPSPLPRSSGPVRDGSTTEIKLLPLLLLLLLPMMMQN